MSDSLDAEQLENFVNRLTMEATASEVHGMFCGFLCGDPEGDFDQWMEINEVTPPSGDLLQQEAIEYLRQAFDYTAELLQENSLDFYPLLPDDEDITVQISGISDWANGFVWGLTQAGITDYNEYVPEVGEFVKDMLKMSALESYELANDNSDEAALVEMIEFIRIGVLLLSEEMNPLPPQSDIDDFDTDLPH